MISLKTQEYFRGFNLSYNFDGNVYSPYNVYSTGTLQESSTILKAKSYENTDTGEVWVGSLQAPATLNLLKYVGI